MTGIPLPANLSGSTAQRVIVIDDALLYLVTGAIAPLVLNQVTLVQTGNVTQDQARDLLSEMFEGLKVPLQLDYWRILPVGMIVSSPHALNFGANFGKVLLCDGTVYSADDYPDLAFILNPGQPFFSVPNLRGRFPVGQKVGQMALSTGGAETVTLTTNQIPAHNHELNAVNSGATLAGYGLNPSAAFTDRPMVQQLGAGSLSTDSAGGGQAHENMPPWIALQFWIIASNV